MVQLWVNLPARNKMTAPHYQPILNAEIPQVPLPAQAGSVRVIAGGYDEHDGPARTFTPMQVWDVRLAAGAQWTLPAREGWSSALVVLNGEVRMNGEQEVGEAQLALLSNAGADVQIEAKTDATVLWLSGEPLNEPIVGQGPFVMNTPEEIRQAIADYHSGHFGRMPD
jgi:quercetin 2,3-dioxygenase